MPPARIEFPGVIVTNGDAGKHFEFYDVRMRPIYLKALERVAGVKKLEGRVLDIGAGPGVCSMMICDKSEFTSIVCLEQSPVFVRIGEAMASRFGYADRVSFKIWERDELPFDDGQFDIIVSLLSLHRWRHPKKILQEIIRVGKEASLVLISDLRRDRPLVYSHLYALRLRMAVGEEIATNFINSCKSAYTSDEVRELLVSVGISDWKLEQSGRILTVTSRTLSQV